MRGAQLLTNHCPGIGLPLAVGLGIMLAGSASAQTANVAAGENRLRHSAIESIRNDIMANWLAPVDLTGIREVHVRIQFRLDHTGTIMGKPKVTMTGGPEKAQKAVAASALRAVVRAAPFKKLPMDKYDVWKEVIINFDASDPAN